MRFHPAALLYQRSSQNGNFSLGVTVSQGRTSDSSGLFGILDLTLALP